MSPDAAGWWPPVAVAAALGAVAAIGLAAGHPLLVTSLSSSAVLIFTTPDSRAARPRAVIGGQVLCAIVGLIVGRALSGPPELVFPVTAAAACAVMLQARCLHPPATTTAMVAAFTHPRASVLVATVLSGSVCLVLFAAALRSARQELPFASPTDRVPRRL